MTNLSATYAQVRRLRASGDCAGAVSALRARPPASDDDAFEAVVCLFVCGDMGNALNVCRTYAWKKEWAAEIAAALAERLAGGDAARAVERARRAVGMAGAPHDASAIYLLLLQEGGALPEAAAYMRQRLEPPPAGEPFLLTVMAETALAMKDWRRAYRAASGVLAHDPDDYRALLALSVANAAIGNSHEALGNARRAGMIERSAPVILQIMRCENKLGDYYAAIAAFEQLAVVDAVPPEIRLELGTAYAGLNERDKAVAEYRAALAADPSSIGALRALLSLHAADGDASAIEQLSDRHRAHVEGDFMCMYSVGIASLHRGDRESAKRAFNATFALAAASPEALHADAWPVPEPRIRHDFEQLELLERRGKLDRAGQEALKLLRRHYDPRAEAHATIAPTGAEGEALRQALSHVHYLPDPAYEGHALGNNDYAAIEDQYRRERLVVIDGFLSPAALAAFREYCEEATVWNAIYNPRGYVGAVLAQGFSPRVLLAIGDELRRAMPDVIADQPLLQAWGFKYDQRMQGINMHADFARVNVNFWLAPDEACEDLATSGLVVYDEPVPQNWTFADYNSDPERLAAYVHVRGAKARRVPYRGNRCVLFDSSLIHVTDELHFRPGYENRRVNVTLLYGKALSVY